MTSPINYVDPTGHREVEDEPVFDIKIVLEWEERITFSNKSSQFELYWESGKKADFMVDDYEAVDMYDMIMDADYQLGDDAVLFMLLAYIIKNPYVALASGATDTILDKIGFTGKYDEAGRRLVVKEGYTVYS